MKTLQKILATILLGAACSSCDLTLIPEDTVTPQTFFKTETDLRLWTNQFYTMLESPDNAAGLNADDMVDKSMGDVIFGNPHGLQRKRLDLDRPAQNQLLSGEFA